MDFKYDTRYEIPDGESAGDFIAQLVHGRVGAQVLLLETHEGRVVGSYERVRDGAVEVEIDATTEELHAVPVNQIVAVTLVDTAAPLDRSDELRG